MRTDEIRTPNFPTEVIERLVPSIDSRDAIIKRVLIEELLALSMLDP